MASIRLQTLAGKWETVGVDRFPGSYPTDISPVYNDSGPDSLAFVVPRPRGSVQNDLTPFTPVDMHAAGSAAPVWSGYVIQAPPSPEGQVQVNCLGWQHILDESQAPMHWVHSQISEWSEDATRVEVMAATYFTQFQFSQDGGLKFLWPNATTVQTTARSSATATLDLGAGNYGDQFIAEVTASANASATFGTIWIHATPYLNRDVVLTSYPWPGNHNAVPLNYYGLGGGGPDVITGPVIGGGRATDRPFRYFTLAFTLEGATPTTPGADIWVKFHRITAGKIQYLVVSPSLGQINWSALNADDVFKDVLIAMLPQLDSSTSQIISTSFNIPHFHFGEPATARTILQKANDYHGYQFGVDAQKRLFFRPQPTVTTLNVSSEASGVEFQDQSTNDGSDIYNQVLVTGQDGAGYPLSATYHAADFTSGYRDAIAAGASYLPTANDNSRLPTNPSFTTDTAGWTTDASVALTRDTTTFSSVPAAGFVNKTNPTPNMGVYTPMQGTFYAGSTYTLTCAVRGGNPGTSVRIYLRASDSSDGNFTDCFVGTVFSNFSVTWTPVRDTKVPVQFAALATAAGTVTYWIDTISLTTRELISVTHANPSCNNTTPWGWKNSTETDSLAETTNYISAPRSASFSAGGTKTVVAYTDVFGGVFKAGVPYRLGIAIGWNVTHTTATWGWGMRWRIDFGALDAVEAPDGHNYSSYGEDYWTPPAAAGTLIATRILNNDVTRRVTWVPDRDYHSNSVQARITYELLTIANNETWSLALADDLTLEVGIPATPMDIRGRRRTFALQMGSPTNYATMRAMAQTFLLAHRNMPFKGTLTINSDTAVTDFSGRHTIPRDKLGYYHGQMIRIVDISDPNTGTQGRDSIITSVNGLESVQLTLDNTPKGLEALIARMDIIQSL